MKRLIARLLVGVMLLFALPVGAAAAASATDKLDLKALGEERTKKLERYFINKRAYQ